jgi:hypothetical protein
MKIHILAAALAVAAAPCAFAQEAAKPAAPMAAPKPAAEMKNLAIFDGNWACDGEVPATPMGPAGKMKTTVSSKSNLGGFWQTGNVTGKMDGMPAFEGMFHMTYDTAGKQYVMVWVDSMGAWATSTSKGWDGDAITFAGETTMNGQKMNTKDTFTKGADGSLKHAWSMEMGGNWAPMGEETCRRPAGAKK